MVERLLCKQDVSGSNPLTSTKNATDKNKENRFSTVIIAIEQEDEDAGVLDSSIEP